MKISNEIDKRLIDLIIDYKCLGAYSDAEEMIKCMDYNCNAFKKMCTLMKWQDKSFKEAQEIILEDIRKEILSIVVDELYSYI